jgi:prevent-host-death family protein
MWSVASAKAHLSEILRRARAGEPQIIGAQDPCVVISQVEYQKFLETKEERHDGLALIRAGAGVGVDIELPSRADDRPDFVFED